MDNLQIGPSDVQIHLASTPYLYHYTLRCMKSFIESIRPNVNVIGNFISMTLSFFPPYPFAKQIIINRLSSVKSLQLKIDEVFHNHLLARGQALLARHGILGCLFKDKFNNKLIVVTDEYDLYNAKTLLERSTYVVLILRVPTTNDNITCTQVAKRMYLGVFTKQEASISRRKLCPNLINQDIHLSLPSMNIIRSNECIDKKKEVTPTIIPTKKTNTLSSVFDGDDFIKPQEITLELKAKKKVMREYTPKYTVNTKKKFIDEQSESSERDQAFQRIDNLYSNFNEPKELSKEDLELIEQDNAFHFYGYGDERNVVKQSQLQNKFFVDLKNAKEDIQEEDEKDDIEQPNGIIQMKDQLNNNENQKEHQLNPHEENPLIELVGESEDYTVEVGLTLELRHILKWDQADIQALMERCEVDYDVFDESIVAKGPQADIFSRTIRELSKEVFVEEIELSLQPQVCGALVMALNGEMTDCSAWYFGEVELQFEDEDQFVHYIEKEVLDLLDDEETNELISLTAKDKKSMQYGIERLNELAKNYKEFKITAKQQKEITQKMKKDKDNYISTQILISYKEQWYLISFNQNILESLERELSFKL
ncbi:hypothetical protein EHI8A_143470 [Entamoeba histolytica HM-1:IMSS-B]|uniref:Uncharacterized protein n=6 Tax=Entamoeba histolytica TaxID=5759 RepID=C4M1N9_ENTH1|nr:hypothetical protein EHI_062530 [Entamoeba histolytica HM-1:IMSS]EMD46791.1 Hypothetical protein EHI5A_179990 [Entamoeba histolytica KU27]EMH72774.1 hypothetical protein EHI8A_143470 [Entamoeba histolytica HM-1:IMSS-B]EMS10858.1 hypothetical protein KM1_216680 [Entamoeba histolytica HM-3:IMSS]ENY65708.1 hypothetical protein EHI7A_129230 [Entamoeba histolytica HM-1:IMSS-A]GAT95145.1 hypothetical protein CL6EHI_062530 [Entamoeba histolytica]|eukprot:XP_648547.1 hypothetical protein EHI_062530 [Entamoeba histolytica HM-1:IMSS]